MNALDRKIFVFVSTILLCPCATLADTPPNPQKTAFEGAVALQNTLTGWALIIFGGSILLILGTGYYRPPALRIRCAYLLFIPGWSFLAAAVYQGTQVQSVYLASLFAAAPVGQGCIGR